MGLKMRSTGRSLLVVLLILAGAEHLASASEAPSATGPRDGHRPTLVAEQGRVTAGPAPKVAGCDQFRDDLGHLTEEGAEHVQQALQARFRDTTALSEDETGSVGGSSPELLRRSYTSSETEREREYFVYLPRGYHDALRKDWPVLLFLHGGGERGDGRQELDWVLAHGPLYEAWIQERDLPFIIVSPQLPVFGRTEQVEGRSAAGQGPPRRLDEGTPPRYEICALEGGGNWGEDCRIAPHRRAFNRGRDEARPIARTAAEVYERIRFFGMDFDYPPEEWPPDGWFRVEDDLVAILDDVLEAFRADPDRVYLTGVSYGGFGVFDLATSYPDLFAALAPVVGTGDVEDAPVMAEAGIPIWMFAGGTDPLVKPHWLYEMARALEEAGHPEVRLTVHEDMAHDAWRRVFEGRDLYDWLLSHRRSQRVGGTSASLRPPPPTLAIENVSVIDVVEGEARQGRTVVVEDERIVEVAPSSRIQLAEGVERVDGSGRYLIPGLWDMHVHAYGGEPRRLLHMGLAFGVTGIRDMGATREVFEKLEEWRRRFRAGEVPGPRIHAAGVIVDGEPRTRPHYITATNAEQAREAVDRLHEMGADLVKVYNRLPRDAFFAAVDEARSRGLEVSGHAPQSVGAGAASDAGMRTIEHADDLAYAVSNRTPPANYRVEERLRAFGSYDEEKAGALIERFARNGTFFVPTLQITYGVIHYEPADLRQGPLARLAPEEPTLPAEDLLLQITDQERPLFDRAYRNILKLVNDMNEEGVRLMAGSHAPLPFIPPGFGLHEEMVRLVEAGLTPAEALRTATLHPARYLDRLDELGTVEEGKLADLVLLDGNPLEDIRHTRQVEAVVMNGRLLDRQALDRMLAEPMEDSNSGRVGAE